MQKVTKSAVMEKLLDETPQTTPPQKEGDTIEGTVTTVFRNTLYVNLGNSKIGVVFGKEYRDAASTIKNLKPEGAVQATIVSLENDEGYVELSMRAATQERAWDVLRRKMDEGEIFSLRIKEVNRGGLIADCEGVGGFMPVSQLSFAHYPRVEGGDKQRIFQELQKFIGQELNVRIIAVDQNENKLIFSEKAAENKELKDAIAKKQVGTVVRGAISGVVNFGAFVKLEDNLEGLIHISELDWQLIEDPHDIVKVGDEVEAQIIGLDDDRISLSLKRLKQNPWDTVLEKYSIGDTVRARIMKLNPFGAFAKLDKDIHGLVHISEFSTEENMKASLKVGEEYDFTILSIEPREYKMALGFGKRNTKKQEEGAIEEKSADEAEQKDEQST